MSRFGLGLVASRTPDPPYDAGTFAQSGTTARAFGDGLAGRRHAGMRFTTVAAGGVTTVKMNITVVSVGFDAIARIYTDNAGSPGTQVGADSDTITLTVALKTWTFATPPSLAATTNYWLVMSDVSAGSGQANIEVWADTSNTNPSGVADTITSIADHSGSIPPAGEGWRIEVTVTPT